MEKVHNKGHIFRQVMFAVLANCLSFCFGLESGWISPTAKILRSDLSPTGDSLSHTTISWIASSMSIAAVFGVPLFSYIAEKYGSKTGIIILAVPQSLSIILKISYSSTTSILLARILFGISGGGVFNVIPMYVKEISEDKTRAILGSLLILVQNLGLFTMYVMGAFLDYYQVLYIMIGLPILTASLMLKAPESPAFLVKLGKIKEATETLSYLRGLNINDKIVENEIQCMINENDEYKNLPSMMSILWMTILGAAILVQQLGITVPSWLPVLALVMIVAMNAGAVAPLPYIIITEMFSFQVRAKVMGAVVTYSWFMSFVTLAIFTPISTYLGYYTAFFFFGAINFIGAIFVYVFMPETKGKSDEEIRRILSNRKK